MNFLDWIKSILSNGRKTPTIYCKGLTKKYDEKGVLEIGLYDGENPITDADIGIEINTRQYIKKTDENGIARLNINLGTGKYKAIINYPGKKDTYNRVTAYTEVFITTDTYMDGINLTKTKGEDTPYQCAVYRLDNHERIKEKINITVNGKTYEKESDDNGLYKLNINLPVGTYDIEAEYKGNDIYTQSKIKNTITINKEIVPTDKKQIVLGCDANTSDDSAVQNQIASRLEAEGYPVEKLQIGPNYFASYDYSSNAKGKIGIYLIASGIFSIADAAYGSGQFDNYIFGIRGDFGDKGATCFDCPIRADTDCTSICDKLDGKTFNQINAMLEPYVAVCGGGKIDELADNIISWLKSIEDKPEPEPKSYEEALLEYFEQISGVEVNSIDEALGVIEDRGYAYYYDDLYDNYTTVRRMIYGDGVNCTDACQAFFNIGVALGYEVHCLHIGCRGGDGHVRLKLKHDINTGGEWIYRDPAAVLSDNGMGVDYNWCMNGELWDIDPSWFMENLYR